MISVKHKILAFILFLGSTLAFSQFTKAQVDPTYAKAPSAVAKSPIALAKYLTENESSDYQKALNIYTWIVNNIKLDVKALDRIKSKNYTPKQTLKRKKGVPSQYAALFVALCQNAGISAKEIHGYGRGPSFLEEDLFYESEHTWNGVKLDSSWYLVDAAWGSGALTPKKRWFKKQLYNWFKIPYINDRYKFIQKPNYAFFMTPPELFLTNHLPSDPSWQLVQYPISVSTFESIEWRAYTPNMDNFYRRQLDSALYTRTLDSYEFLSDGQYRQIEGKKSNEFNQRNFKQLGYSTVELAQSYARKGSDLESRLTSQEEAVRLFKLGIQQLKRHKASAQATSKRIEKTVKLRITKDLKKPLNRRINVAERDNKEAFNFLSKSEQLQENRSIQIQKLEQRILKGFQTYSKPPPSKSKKSEIVEKNTLKIDNLLLSIAKNKDSLEVILENFHQLIEKQELLQDSIIYHYEMLPSLLERNKKSIIENEGISKITVPIELMDSIGTVIDSLNARKRSTARDVKKLKNTIRQLHASIISESKEVQRLVMENCRLSQNEICEGHLFNDRENDIESIINEKLSIENEFYEYKDKEAMYYRAVNALLVKILKTMEGNAEFIAHFEARRIDGIRWKKSKSDHHVNKLIAASQEGISRLESSIAQLKIEKREQSKARTN